MKYIDHARIHHSADRGVFNVEYAAAQSIPADFKTMADAERAALAMREHTGALAALARQFNNFTDFPGYAVRVRIVRAVTAEKKAAAEKAAAVGRLYGRPFDIHYCMNMHGVYFIFRSDTAHPADYGLWSFPTIGALYDAAAEYNDCERADIVGAEYYYDCDRGLMFDSRGVAESVPAFNLLDYIV